jgi:hypothetical protein
MTVPAIWPVSTCAFRDEAITVMISKMHRDTEIEMDLGILIDASEGFRMIWL